MSYAPILIFAYNRPDKLSALLNSLAACPELDASEITIFIDGPKNDCERELTALVNQVARKQAPEHARISARTENLGLRRSIMTGVTETLKKHENVIVLEDDLEVSSHLLAYFNAALETYKRNERVVSLAGYMFDVPQIAKRNSSFFLPFPNPWGWATWRSRWEPFAEGKVHAEAELRSRSFRESFNAYGVRNFTSILELDQANLVNSWFINWYLSTFRRGGLTLWPPVSLIKNKGLGGGTHSTFLNIHRFLSRPNLPEKFRPQLPEVVSLDYTALDLIRDSRDVRIQKLVSQIGVAKRRLLAPMRARG